VLTRSILGGRNVRARKEVRLGVPPSLLRNLPTGERINASESQWFQYECLLVGSRFEGAAHHRKAHIMRKTYFGDESAFEHIWNNADRDGLWNGDATTLAAEFGVTENEAHEVLGELCDQNRIQRVGTRDYIIVTWRERDEPGEE
jgi:hypothetical protein